MIRIALLIMVAIVMMVFFITGNGAPRGDIKSQKTQTSQSADTTRPVGNSQPNTAVGNKPAVKLNSDSVMATKENNYVQAAFKFLEDNKSHYKISDPRSEFIVRGESDKANWHTVKLDQVHNGVKVQNGCFNIIFSYNRPLSFNDVFGDYDPDARTVDTKPAISEEQAKRIALDDPRSKGAKSENIKKAELLIQKFKDSYGLFWNIDISRMDSLFLSLNYLIDAKTGVIEHVGNTMIIEKF